MQGHVTKRFDELFRLWRRSLEEYLKARISYTTHRHDFESRD